MLGGIKWPILFLILGVCAFTDAHDTDEEVSVETEDAVQLQQEDEILYVSPKPIGFVYLAENFDEAHAVFKQWVKSEARKEGADENIAKYNGIWEVEAPQKDGLKGDLGLVLKSKAKHFAISTMLNRPFYFRDKPLIVQYQVQFQEGQECGGAYIKLLTKDDKLVLSQFTDRTPYTIMFGPDKCGSDAKLHFIFRHKNPLTSSFSEKHAKKPSGKFEESFKDKNPHLYTLVLQPDNTFEISLDNKVINSGNLLEDMSPSVNPPREIEDVEDFKPEDWDEREKIADPNAKKPDDWDETAPRQIPDETAHRPDGWLEDETEMIPDPNAEKPDDWDEEMDGEWEAPLVNNPVCEQAPGCGEWKPPLIDNPNYKGKWSAPMIDNPNYKGKWKRRKILNPDFFEDLEPFRMSPIAAVGFELWSISDMVLFDDFIITDDKKVAEHWAQETFTLKRSKINKDSEGVFTRILNYTNKHPWLWAVYVVVIGLPIVLIFAFCCGSASQEKEDPQKMAIHKKTDAVTPDYAPDSKAQKEGAAEVQEAEKNEEAEEETEGAVDREEEAEDDKVVEEDDTSQEEEEEESAKPEKETVDGAGDVGKRTSPRKRRTRKE